MHPTPKNIAQSDDQSFKCTLCPGRQDFSWENIPKYVHRDILIPSDHKIYQTALKYSSGHKIKQLFIFQGSQKYTQVEIFGMKIYHLATLPWPVFCAHGFFFCITQNNKGNI
jgi:hypothetical protein